MSLLASDSIFLVQGDIFSIVLELGSVNFMTAVERSNRALEIGHRAAIVGGFTSRYRSSFIGDGGPVRISLDFYDSCTIPILITHNEL